MTAELPGGGACHRPGAGVTPEDNCLTCGDVAVEARVVRLLPGALAVVAVGAAEEQVSVALVNAVPGDTLLVHAGEAIAVVGGDAVGGDAVGGDAVGGDAVGGDVAGGDPVTSRPDPGGAAAMRSLYPFLFEGHGDLPAVLEQVRASTVAKLAEIRALRHEVATRDGARIGQCAHDMAARFTAGGRLFAFGNGGSATDAQQVATLFLHPGGAAPALPAFGLASDTSVVTALCNDIGVEVVFARQLGAFGCSRDIALGLSTSGNSANLVRAFGEAAQRGMLTVGLAGYEGGAMAELDTIDYLFVVPSASVHRIQEAQTTIYQVLWELTVQEVAHVPRHTR
jgi:D-sedoheptulose 7-phosphate isomerase